MLVSCVSWGGVAGSGVAGLRSTGMVVACHAKQWVGCVHAEFALFWSDLMNRVWPWGQRSGTELAVRYLGAVSFRSVGIAVSGSCMRGLVRIEAVRFLGRAIRLLWTVQFARCSYLDPWRSVSVL